MKKLTILSLISFLIGCGVKSESHSKVVNTERNLRFLVENKSGNIIKDIEVRLVDTILHFSNLSPNSRTEWIMLAKSYKCGWITVKDYKDTVSIMRPRDYMGEQLYNKGDLTFVIGKVYSENKYFDFTSIFKLK